MIKVECAGHLASMGKKRPTYRILTTKSEEKRLIERS
jgi:hypothetical protein